MDGFHALGETFFNISPICMFFILNSLLFNRLCVSNIKL